MRKRMKKQPVVEKAPAPAPVEPKPAPTPVLQAAGFNEQGIEAYIRAAEDNDRGTRRFPWPDAFKRKLANELNGLDTVDQMRDKLNSVVVAELGGGLHNRGPLA